MGLEWGMGGWSLTKVVRHKGIVHVEVNRWGVGRLVLISTVWIRTRIEGNELYILLSTHQSLIHKPSQDQKSSIHPLAGFVYPRTDSQISSLVLIDNQTGPLHFPTLPSRE